MHLKTQISRELDRLELLLDQIKRAEAERDALLAAQQAATPASPGKMLLEFRGIGAEFAASLWLEALFRQFGNRRQLASYAGLAPTPWQSGSVDHQQGVSEQVIRDCEPPWFSLPGYGSAISRNRRWPCGSKNGSTPTAAG